MTKPYVRLDKNKAVVLLVDHQTGLLSLVRDIDPDKFKNNVLAVADLAKPEDHPDQCGAPGRPLDRAIFSKRGVPVLSYNPASNGVSSTDAASSLRASPA
jgi:hypothetical protein